MAHAHTRAGKFQITIGGLVIAGAIMTACTSPLSQYVNAVWLAMSGLMLAAAFFAYYQLAVRTTLDPNLKKVARVMAGLGIFGMSVTFADAIVTAQDHDAVCSTEQQRMFRGEAAGSKAGGPSAVDVFRALRCDYAN